MKRTRIFSALLCLTMLISLMAGCQNKPAEPSASASVPASGSQQEPAPSGREETVRFAALSDSAGMGGAWMMKRYAPGNVTEGLAVESEILPDSGAALDALVSGSADIAAIAPNSAAALSVQTDDAVQVLAVNTLGSVYILEKGDTVHSISDLRGKTLCAIGQDDTPAYILSFLLRANGVDPSEVDIQFMPLQEITEKMSSSESALCMLPVPAAADLLVTDQDVRQAVSLSEAWEALDRGPLPQGCIAARRDFVEAHPEQVEEFMDLYHQSISFMNDEANRAQAAAMIAELGIASNEALAAQAIPQSNLTFITGTEMKEMLENYYAVLFQANPASIGGAMPYDSFYYGAG